MEDSILGHSHSANGEHGIGYGCKAHGVDMKSVIFGIEVELNLRCDRCGMEISYLPRIGEAKIMDLANDALIYHQNRAECHPGKKSEFSLEGKTYWIMEKIK